MMPLPAPYHEDRPWGWFRRFTNNESTTVKILHVHAGALLSLQSHAKRSEFWRVLSGDPILIVDDMQAQGKPGDEFFVPVGAKHRIQGGAHDAEILEIAHGIFDEDDVARYEDIYGRA